MWRQNIPELLKNHRGWLSWEDKRGRKVPRMPEWPTANLHSFEQIKNITGGIGFRPDNLITVIDLDDIQLPEGVDRIEGLDDLPPKVREFVELCDSYTEVSPSGNGLHILLIGPWRLDDGKWTGQLNLLGLPCTMEVWSYNKRWVAMTGDSILGEIRANTQVAEMIISAIQDLEVLNTFCEADEPSETKSSGATVGLSADEQQESIRRHAIAAMDSIARDTPTVRGEDCEAVLLEVARCLIRLGCSESTAVDLLLHYWNDNHTYIRVGNDLAKDPEPWSLSEIQHKTADAHAFVYDNGLDLETRLADLAALVTPVNPSKGKAGEDDDELVKWADVGDHVDHDMTYVWEGRIAKGELTLLHCAPKVGKTTFTLELLSPDDHFLGAAKLKSPETIYVSEEPWHIWQLRIQKKIPDIAAGGDTVRITRPRVLLGKEQAGKVMAFFKKVVGWIEESKKAGRPIDILIIDPLSTFTGGDENDALFITKLFEQLKEIASACDVAVIVIHHSRKSLQSTGSFDSHNARGSGVITSMPDNIIQIAAVAAVEPRGKKVGVQAHRLAHIVGRTTGEQRVRFVMQDERLIPFLPAVTAVNPDDPGATSIFGDGPVVTYDPDVLAAAEQRQRGRAPAWNRVELSITDKRINELIDSLDLEPFIVNHVELIQAAHAKSIEEKLGMASDKHNSFTLRLLFSTKELIESFGGDPVLYEVMEQTQACKSSDAFGGDFNYLMGRLIRRAIEDYGTRFKVRPKGEAAMDDLLSRNKIHASGWLELT